MFKHINKHIKKEKSLVYRNRVCFPKRKKEVSPAEIEYFFLNNAEITDQKKMKKNNAEIELSHHLQINWLLAPVDLVVSSGRPMADPLCRRQKLSPHFPVFYIFILYYVIQWSNLFIF